MQSGRAKTRFWLVEFEPGGRLTADPLMGWQGRGDTRNQLKMRFDSKEEAIAHCEREGLEYVLHEPRTRTHRPKSYSENFAYGRHANWTH